MLDPSVREPLSIISVNINNWVPAELAISNEPNLAAGTTINKSWRINQWAQLSKESYKNRGVLIGSLARVYFSEVFIIWFIS